MERPRSAVDAEPAPAIWRPKAAVASAQPGISPDQITVVNVTDFTGVSLDFVATADTSGAKAREDISTGSKTPISDLFEFVRTRNQGQA